MMRCALASWIAMIVVCATSARAVILYQNPNRNLRAPTGSLANSGWQWEGNFFDTFPGTPISKKYFITASHIGGGVGNTFTYQGVAHRVTNVYDDPDTDLRVCSVTGTFDAWAPIYRGSSEVNNAAMIYGRGTQRGDPIFVNRQAKGWMWGPGDSRMSWGRNAISSIANGGENIGEVLDMTFDEHGPAYEATISEGDSGGGVFIKTASGWELAGVNYGIDGNYSLTKGGSGFRAAIFDRGGLYQNGTTLVKDASANVPQNIYATRVSARQSWIDGVFNGSIAPDASPSTQGLTGSISVTPEPTGAVVFAAIAIIVVGRRGGRQSACGR